MNLEIKRKEILNYRTIGVKNIFVFKNFLLENLSILLPCFLIGFAISFGINHLIVLKLIEYKLLRVDLKINNSFLVFIFVLLFALIFIFVITFLITYQYKNLNTYKIKNKKINKWNFKNCIWYIFYWYLFFTNLFKTK